MNKKPHDLNNIDVLKFLRIISLTYDKYKKWTV